MEVQTVYDQLPFLVLKFSRASSQLPLMNRFLFDLAYAQGFIARFHNQLQW